MAAIKVAELAYVRVRVPDLAQAETFFTDFGLLRAARTDEALYLRGSGPSHHIHVVERGEAKFVSVAFLAASRDDLDRIAAEPGASRVEDIAEPGGGKRVWLQDPDGNRVEVVHGIAPVEPIRHARHALNDGVDGLRRVGQLSRHTVGPSKVLRVGHGVLMSHDPATVVKWYQDTFGLVCSDLVVDDGGRAALSFNRLDRGPEYVDHHVLLVQGGPKKGLNHVGFELHDLDDLMVGHRHMKAKGYDNVWAIGRHTYGSQIFDYWMDSFDFMYEHWTDTDRLNHEFRGEVSAPLHTAEGPWGADVPERFFTHAHE